MKTEEELSVPPFYEKDQDKQIVHIDSIHIEHSAKRSVSVTSKDNLDIDAFDVNPRASIKIGYRKSLSPS